jgi:endoglucanase
MSNRLSYSALALLIFMTSSLQGALIHVNQLGYYPQHKKIAIVVGASLDSFSVVDVENNNVVFKGKLTQGGHWDASDENTQIADFSAFNAAGQYKISVGNDLSSHQFSIKPHVHLELSKASIKAYYFNRASMEIDPLYGGKWARPMGHPDNEVEIHSSAESATRPAGTIVSSPMGWYDAGDYGKYIVNSGITTYTLFAAYQAFPEFYDTLNLNIPESSNNLPDIIDEILWNLRWMLTMQDPEDGGVYHKLTTAGFSGFIMPDEDDETRYIVKKGTAATLDFAAVTAQASRILRKFESEIPGLADSCLNASMRAWEWARKNDSVVFKNPTGISTGEYGDRSFKDEFHWAAIELYVATRIDSFFTIAQKKKPSKGYGIPGWNDVNALGLYTLILTQDSLTSVVSKDTLKSDIAKLTDSLLIKYRNNPYRVSMTAKDFYWASNSVAANQAMALIIANKIEPRTEYIEAATGILDYLLGKNPTGYCYVTGMGSKKVMNPHHRPSGADTVTDPVPGFLVGGPNPNQEDTKGCFDCPEYPSKLPALSFVDHQESYASNEVAINWNAPLVFLSGALESIHGNLPINVKRPAVVKRSNSLPYIRAGKDGVFIRLPSNWSKGTITLNDLSGKVIQKSGIDINGNVVLKVKHSNQIMIMVIDAISKTGEKVHYQTRLNLVF